jgi:hypothetical protein
MVAEVLIAPNPRGIGDNRPPETIDQFDAEILLARLDRDYAELAGRFVELELGVAKVPAQIMTEEQAKKITDWVGQQCRVLIAKAEADRVREKRPYLEGGRAVDKFFLDRIKRLTNAIGPIERRIKKYHDLKKIEQRRREEAERRQAQETLRRERDEAQRLAAEAQASEAAGDRRSAIELTREAERAETNAALAAVQAVAPPAPVTIRGDYGSTAFSVERWDYEVLDPTEVPLGLLTIDDAAVRQLIAGGTREIAGIRIFPVDRFTIKRC